MATLFLRGLGALLLACILHDTNSLHWEHAILRSWEGAHNHNREVRDTYRCQTARLDPTPAGKKARMLGSFYAYFYKMGCRLVFCSCWLLRHLLGFIRLHAVYVVCPPVWFFFTPNLSTNGQRAAHCLLWCISVPVLGVVASSVEALYGVVCCSCVSSFYPRSPLNSLT